MERQPALNEQPLEDLVREADLLVDSKTPEDQERLEHLRAEISRRMLGINVGYGVQQRNGS